MRRDIQQHVQDCHYCKCRKADNRIATIPIQRFELLNRPFEQVHADVTGPFNMTRNGNKYLLVIRDRLSKYIIIIPIKERKAETIREKLNDVFSIFGYPSKLVTDRGTEFSIKNMEAMLEEKRSDAQHKRISPQAPRANGEAENAMRYIKDILVAYINKFQDNWDIHVREIQSIMNSYISDSTGYTPYYVLFGREISQIDETYFDNVKPNKMREYRAVMEQLWEEIATKVTVTNVEKFNKPTKEPLKFQPFNVGDFVFIKRIPRKFFKYRGESEKYVSSRKLQYRYTGPFMVKQVKSSVNYVLDIHGKRRSIHAINMKKA
jgi:hypothetical protein